MKMKLNRNRRRLLASTLAALCFSSGNYVSAEGLIVGIGKEPIDRTGRYLGIGWGDGYHACDGSGARPCSDLPPVSSRAIRRRNHLKSMTFYDKFDESNVIHPTQYRIRRPVSPAPCDGSENCDSAMGYESMTDWNVQGEGISVVTDHEFSSSTDDVLLNQPTITQPTIAQPVLAEPKLPAPRRIAPVESTDETNPTWDEDSGQSPSDQEQRSQEQQDDDPDDLLSGNFPDGETENPQFSRADLHQTYGSPLRLPSVAPATTPIRMPMTASTVANTSTARPTRLPQPNNRPERDATNAAIATTAPVDPVAITAPVATKSRQELASQSVTSPAETPLPAGPRETLKPTRIPADEDTDRDRVAHREQPESRQPAVRQNPFFR
ncbi:hypothetical protein N9N28_05840 [Rubripirellula amarantea]|nr:hypothetical protein [Rubripirellula amarantea]